MDDGEEHAMLRVLEKSDHLHVHLQHRERRT
jgi:hypothetical protein